jgi:hypothetical protein
MNLNLSSMFELIQQPLFPVGRSIIVDYIATALTLFLVYLIRTRYFHGLNKIPGPFLASVTSLWKWDIVRREKMPFVNTQLHEKHGPLVRIGPNHISASSAESIQVVHRSKSGFTKVILYRLLFLFRPFTNRYSEPSPVYTEYCNRVSKAQTCTMSSRPRTLSTMQR